MDMLVKLYDLPEISMEALAQIEHRGIVIRRAMAPEKHLVVQWVRETFGHTWGNETDIAFGNQPISCFIAVDNKQIVGFACYEVTARNFFGPTGVAPSHRGLGLGKILFLKALYALREMGYAYAIIGGVGPSAFYTKIAGAVEIPSSTPGIYKGLLKENE